MSKNGVGLRAKFFRGLADPSRLTILEALLDGPKHVGELVRRSRLSQPNVSQHMNCLRCCGLVTSAREGRRVYYRVASPGMRRLLEQAADILREAERAIRA
jgi:DNA-binding transcriptional ArsR family regulator